MYDPLVVLIYSHSADYQPLLEWQLKQAGIDTLHSVDPDFSWRRRQILTRNIASEHPDRLLIFPDAWDTVLLASREAILALPLAGVVTVAGAKVCWPDDRHDDYARKYGAVRDEDGVWRTSTLISPWRYVNSNPLAGLGKDIVRAIDWGWERFPLVGDSADVRVENGEVCERFWTRLYLDGPESLKIRVDTECALSQIYLCNQPGDLEVVSGRVRNRVTGTWPAFLHLNGKHLLPEGLIEL